MKKLIAKSLLAFILPLNLMAQSNAQFEREQIRSYCTYQYNSALSDHRKAVEELKNYLNLGSQRSYINWKDMKMQHWTESAYQVFANYETIITAKVEKSFQSLTKTPEHNLIRLDFKRAYKENTQVQKYVDTVLEQLTTTNEAALEAINKYEGRKFKSIKVQMFSPQLNIKNTSVQSCILVQRKGIDINSWPVKCFDLKLIPVHNYSSSLPVSFLYYVARLNEQSEYVYSSTFNGIDLAKFPINNMYFNEDSASNYGKSIIEKKNCSMDDIK